MKTSDKAHLQMALGKIFDAILGDFLCSLKAITMVSMCPLVSFFPLHLLSPSGNMADTRSKLKWGFTISKHRHWWTSERDV